MDGTVRYGAGILTVSTKGARGERDDESGRVAVEMATAAGFDVTERLVVTDDRGEIAHILGCRVGTSKSQLHKARAKMRDLLAAKGEVR